MCPAELYAKDPVAYNKTYKSQAPETTTLASNPDDGYHTTTIPSVNTKENLRREHHVRREHYVKHRYGYIIHHYNACVNDYNCPGNSKCCSEDPSVYGDGVNTIKKDKATIGQCTKPVPTSTE